MIDPAFSPKIPDGDNVSRLVCDHCQFIHYVNPKVIVGTVATWNGRFLLCRRAIPPREGYWTIPAGFLEERETTEEGAIRETHEEAGARVELDALLAIYNIPHVSQVQLIYRGHLIDETIEAGIESEEVALFEPSEIPRSELAFPSVHWALDQYQQVAGEEAFPPFGNPPDVDLSKYFPHGL